MRSAVLASPSGAGSVEAAGSEVLERRQRRQRPRRGHTATFAPPMAAVAAAAVAVAVAVAAVVAVAQGEGC